MLQHTDFFPQVTESWGVGDPQYQIPVCKTCSYISTYTWAFVNPFFCCIELVYLTGNGVSKVECSNIPKYQCNINLEFARQVHSGTTRDFICSF